MAPHGPTRRECLAAGLTVPALSLPGVLRLRAASRDTGTPTRNTAVIFVTLGGGASQFETYDPKPDAPAECRGAFGSIATAVPGVRFCELMPRQAALAKHVAVVRSVTHHEASHIALHAVETGYFLKNSGNALAGEMPAVGSVAAKARGGGAGGLPGFVSLPRMPAYSGPHHLGKRYAAFDVAADPNDPAYRVANLDLVKGVTPERMNERRALLGAVDDRPVPDLDGTASALDSFQRQALELVTGEKARAALDVAREPDKVRDAYGRTPFGQRLLLARRLAEAGVPFVAVRTFDWDDHDKLPERMKARCPEYDTGLAALVGDLVARGMDRDVLVVSMGEFGRTPKVNVNAGRDHWPAAASVLFAGGGFAMGQAIGASDSKGGAVTRAPYLPQQVLGMVYRHLGIDPGTTFPDFTGRPRHVLEERDPIAELT
ncbi:MAG: DUF1501 domain-containing protein [Planctomycetes bacterium]|nr:DUF1501 domain-containing protein [Planctomycetota bacterium]